MDSEERKKHVEKAILDSLHNIESPLSNLVGKIVVDMQATKDTILVMDILNDLLQQGKLVVTGFSPHLLSKRDLDVRIKLNPSAQISGQYGQAVVDSCRV